MPFLRLQKLLSTLTNPTNSTKFTKVPKVYSAENRMLVWNMKNVLESHGISCIVKNDQLFGAMGELPPIECWPELWVETASEVAKAEKLLEAATSTSSGPDWTCPSCGETHAAQFTACWKCENDELSC